MSHKPLMKNVSCDDVSENNQLHVARLLHVAALQQFRDECVWFSASWISKLSVPREEIRTP